MRGILGQVEASAIIEADRRELFCYTDWCYNVPEWFSAIRKTRILKLPNSNGLGKITYYNGTILGRQLEWESQLVEWKENEFWKMKAFKGMTAKMNMYMKLLFEDAGAGGTKVTGLVGFRAPYPIIGPLIDRFYLRNEAQRLVNVAIGGLKCLAAEHKIPSVASQLEKRKVDHPGYTGPQVSSLVGSIPHVTN